ncbi:MAG: lipid A deacylase LpxR family protein [Bacteroidota bacterium]
MTIKASITIAAMALLPHTAGAQAMDYALSPGLNELPARYFRFSYENDFFTATDTYYTQGIQALLIHPGLAANPANKILVRLKNGVARYGIAAEHNGYTPTSITNPAPLYNDRPYAGALMIRSFRATIDTVRKQRLTSSVSIGVMGPLAEAGEMQTAIHRGINGYLPRGWHYQVRNDLVLNYEVLYEKQLLNLGNHISLTAAGKARVGTLSTKAGIGVTVMTGFFAPDRAFNIYLYAMPFAHVVAYDATLQGGLLNKTSEVTVPASEINRTTLQMRYGLVMRYKRLDVSYSFTSQTREFENANPHRWGCASLGWRW